MSDKPRDDRSEKMPEARTASVGNQPPGGGAQIGTLPRNLEILIQKAAVDPEFKARLLEKRSAAAVELEMTLGPAEVAMLDSVPTEQLEAIIAGTKVPEKTRRALLGTVTVATLAALGHLAVCKTRCEPRLNPLGIEPDRPLFGNRGTDPDRPASTGG